MLVSSPKAARAARRLAVAICALTLVGALPAVSQAQFFANTRAVGGVFVDTGGVLRNAAVDDLGELARVRARGLEGIPHGLGGMIELRKVSLRGLEAAIQQSVRSGKKRPDEVECLAGLQQIRYVLVYPDRRDIVLVGPGEGWKVDRRGNVVGITTGRPVMLLEDLLVALRSARRAANGGISCSIDPTAEGVAEFSRYMGQFRTMGNPAAIAAGAEKALGRQNITLTNVPPESHFARVLVAADYRMKRIGMGLQPSPVRGLPSYVQMAKATRGQNSMPRWWLEPNYEPLLRSPDGLAWQLRGGSVKTLTEDAFLAAGGLKRTGKTSPIAQKWADVMTQKYDELAVADPVFGQLRNCMELAVVGALIVKEGLTEKAGYSMPTLLDPADVKVGEFPAPKQIDSQVSMVKKGRNWMITASGGVMLNSWGIADRVSQSDAPAAIRSQAAADKNTHWWWN